eukprot:TRINITY_DN9382_c0_g1_i2.p2 TRINITY_DN9382_c0_g1~~TRINITY_DN9382_c0_g1_i2.p2  ORF type:complete len:108 (+),score=22.31 TRINITY_DN9382_c0_g1_i2:66-389(+)
MTTYVEPINVKPSKVYTWEEVATHNTAKSLWIVLWDQVYDVTKFVSKHPGGTDVLLKVAGQDATEFFLDVGHSRDAIQSREQFAIGMIDKPNDHPPEKQASSCCTIS